MESIDIWRSANVMLKYYGADATFMAAMRADALLDQGDTKGFRAWKHIMGAIEELGRTKPSPSEPMNQVATRLGQQMEEIDVWRSADLLIKQHGDKADEVAAGKVVEMQRADDGEGIVVWVQIMLAIRELAKPGPPEGWRANQQYGVQQISVVDWRCD